MKEYQDLEPDAYKALLIKKAEELIEFSTENKHNYEINEQIEILIKEIFLFRMGLAHNRATEFLEMQWAPELKDLSARLKQIVSNSKELDY